MMLMLIIRVLDINFSSGQTRFVVFLSKVDDYIYGSGCDGTLIYVVATVITPQQATMLCGFL